jgi:hypothetical protein
MATDLERFRDHCTEMAKAVGPDRDTWRLLADETDEYLTRLVADGMRPGDTHDVPLFGDPS